MDSQHLDSFDWDDDVVEATENLLSSHPLSVVEDPTNTQTQIGTSLAKVTANVPQEVFARYSQPKYIEPVVRDPDSQKIVAYYDPITLAPEYDEPALIQLNYTHGYPAVNGSPFWERLPNEPVQYHQAYVHYLGQTVSDPSNEDKKVMGARRLDMTAKNFQIAPRTLELVAEMWMWAQRAQAFDQYNARFAEAMQITVVNKMKSKHLELAEELFKKLRPELLDMDLKELSPAQLQSLLDQVIKLERISNNLPGDEPEKAQDGGSINISGEGQKVQIIQTKDWNPG